MTHIFNIEQGEARLFSDFESNGNMWSGKGDRRVDYHINLGNLYKTPPKILINITLLDAASDQHVRFSLAAENITNSGFDIVFKTWLDSRFARVWVQWTALGEISDPDMWENL